MKSGYIYVLIHPSDSGLYKIGQTSRTPEERLYEHNTDRNKLAGKIVEATGQKWELKTHFAVPDPRWAETVFWANTHWHYVPFRGGIEIQRMEWDTVEQGLSAAKKAGLRPPPAPTPDYVYAYTASMRKQLKGRGIAVQGLVKSRSGKSTFRCQNGHQWRAPNQSVADGEGCPTCGMGQRTPDEVRRSASPGVLCLLVHPDRPKPIKMGLTYSTLEQCWKGNVWPDWVVHRYRRVSEPVLAETLIWEMLGCPAPQDGETSEIPLSTAEQAMRDLTSRMDTEIALLERARETGIQSVLPPPTRRERDLIASATMCFRSVPHFLQHLSDLLRPLFGFLPRQMCPKTGSLREAKIWRSARVAEIFR